MNERSQMQRRLNWCALLGFVTAMTLAGSSRASEPETTLEFDAGTEEWRVQEPSVPGTPGGDLEVVQDLLDDGAFKKARKAIHRWFKTYQDEERWRPRALITRAQAELAMENFETAHKVLQEFLSDYPASPLDTEALHMEFTIAETFLGGTKRKFLGMRLLSGEETAMTILDDIGLNYGQSSFAELALKTKADYFFNRGEYVLAEMEYARLADSFPRSRYLRYALRKSADAAFASFGGVELDEAGLIEADERYREYLRLFPTDPQAEEINLLLERIRSSRAAKDLEIARYHERARQLRAATFYYRATVEDWPDTIAAAQAQRWLETLSPGAIGDPVADEPPTTAEPLGADEPAKVNHP